MKKALAVVLAAAFLCVSVGGALAQVPYVQVYFDPNYHETQANCGQPGTLQDLYVVGLNWNMFVQAVDYMINLPPALLYVSDTPNLGPNDLSLGSSNTGLAIAYNLPQNGFSLLFYDTVHTLWTSNCNCDPASGGGLQPLVVVGYPGSPAPSAVRWPDFSQLYATGMTSLICPGAVATKPSTWGEIKALYR